MYEKEWRVASIRDDEMGNDDPLSQSTNERGGSEQQSPELPLVLFSAKMLGELADSQVCRFAGLQVHRLAN